MVLFSVPGPNKFSGSEPYQVTGTIRKLKTVPNIEPGRPVFFYQVFEKNKLKVLQFLKFMLNPDPNYFNSDSQHCRHLVIPFLISQSKLNFSMLKQHLNKFVSDN